MNKRDIERLKKKILKIEKTFNDMAEKLNRDIHEVITLLENDVPPTSTSKSRRQTPQRGGKATLEDYDDNVDNKK